MNSYLLFYQQNLVLQSNGMPIWTEQQLLPGCTDAEVIEVENHADNRLLALDLIENITGLPTITLRDELFAENSDLFLRVSRAIQLINFYKRHRYCHLCGGRLTAILSPGIQSCPQCAHRVYAPVAPCVIVLIERGEECLLARRHHAGHDRYSLISGFIDAGENAEQAVMREVSEEVGLQLHSPRYFGSQSWPFPHQLMFGYVAQWQAGEIRLQEEELRDANWFHYRTMPDFPGPETIAGRMILDFVQRCQKSAERIQK